MRSEALANVNFFIHRSVDVYIEDSVMILLNHQSYRHTIKSKFCSLTHDAFSLIKSQNKQIQLDRAIIIIIIITTTMKIKVSCLLSSIFDSISKFEFRTQVEYQSA